MWSMWNGVGRMSLYRHLKRTALHPIRSLLREPFVILDPTEFAVFGIRKQLEVIEMHRDYFLPGKPVPGQATLVKFVNEVAEPHVRQGSSIETFTDSSLDWYFN